MIGLTEVEGGATVAMEYATAIGSMAEPMAEKLKNFLILRIKKKLCSEEGLQSKKEINQRQGQTRITTVEAFPH